MRELIRDITSCILFAWVLGLLAHFFRQPLILAYLIAGFLIGPFGPIWVKVQESIGIVISEPGLWAPSGSRYRPLHRQRRSALRIDAGAEP